MTLHPDEQARELAREFLKGSSWEGFGAAERALIALLAHVRQQALEEAEFAFKGAYAEYEESLIGVMWGLKAIASLRQAAGEKEVPK